MPDKERVVKAWEIFRDSNPYEICSGREFRAIREPEYCMGQMIEDTIALLKEQEAKEVNESTNMYTGLPITHCPKCGVSLDRYLYGRQHEGQVNYCPHCGQAVKWICD